MIRLNDQIIQGPMDQDQLFNYLNSKGITENVELTGDLGPWVFIINKEEMILYYPNIFKKIELNEVYKKQSGLISKIKKILN